MFRKTCLKMIKEQEIHVHHHYGGSDSGSDSKSTKSDSSKSSSATKTSDSDQPDDKTLIDAQMQQQDHQQEKTVNQQKIDLQVSKFMNKKLGIKDDKDDKAQFKEVFIKNHIRRYQRKPSIGMMKQSFGVHN